MFTASAKKKENIAEYLLYMWQIEDIIRAYRLDLDRIRTEIVNAYTGLTEEQRTQLYEWYESLIDMMRSENVVEQGHLQLNKNVIIDLTDLHLRLLKSPNEPFYTAAFYKALPYIVELRAKSQGAQVGEIETCFNALYGILMLRLQQREVSEDTIKAMKDITAFMTLLSEKYRLEKAGELEL